MYRAPLEVFFFLATFARKCKRNMIPKIIHLCWFSNDPYPVEIKVCLDTWKKLLPDFQVKVWDYAAAKSIGCDFIDEALEARKWAFAADVVRFYAVYQEGGVYMDSDIYLLRRFDEIFPEDGFVTFHEKDKENFGLQAAFFLGAAGNAFCKKMLDYYAHKHFVNPDGSFNDTISPYTMSAVAKIFGWQMKDELQTLPGLTVYPTHFLAPNNHYPVDAETIGVHTVCGSWRKRKIGRYLEIKIKHLWHVVKYALFKK